MTLSANIKLTEENRRAAVAEKLRAINETRQGYIFAAFNQVANGSNRLAEVILDQKNLSIEIVRYNMKEASWLWRLFDAQRYPEGDVFLKNQAFGEQICDALDLADLKTNAAYQNYLEEISLAGLRADNEKVYFPPLGRNLIGVYYSADIVPK